MLLYFLWTFTFNMFWLSPSSAGSGPNQGSLTDDKSRGSQVGCTHPHLRWVWQRLEGESSLQLILFASAVSSSEPLEGLLIVEPAGREMRGQMWPQTKARSRQSFAATFWKGCHTWSPLDADSHPRTTTDRRAALPGRDWVQPQERPERWGPVC